MLIISVFVVILSETENMYFITHGSNFLLILPNFGKLSESVSVKGQNISPEVKQLPLFSSL